jgi:hypothetical protein
MKWHSLDRQAYDEVSWREHASPSPTFITWGRWQPGKMVDFYQ